MRTVAIAGLISLSGCYGSLGATAGLSARHGFVLGWETSAGSILGGTFGQTFDLGHRRMTSYGGFDAELFGGFQPIPAYMLERIQIGISRGEEDGLLLGLGVDYGEIGTATHGFLDVTIWFRIEGADLQILFEPRVGYARERN